MLHHDFLIILAISTHPALQGYPKLKPYSLKSLVSYYYCYYYHFLLLFVVLPLLFWSSSLPLVISLVVTLPRKGHSSQATFNLVLKFYILIVDSH